MARLQSCSILFIIVFLMVADAALRTRRSPQFSQANASAASFGGGGFGGHGRGFGRPGIGPPGPQFGPSGRHFGPPRPQFGPYQPPFGPHGNPGFPRHNSGGSINIAKSISISTGGSGPARSQASSQAGSFGK